MSDRSFPEQPDPGERLNQQAEALASRQQARLEAMTAIAVTGATVSWSAERFRWGVTVAVALSVAVIFMVVLTQPAKQPSQLATVQSQSLIPEWVSDDAVPVSLLENMDLYVWISQHPSEEIQG